MLKEDPFGLRSRFVWFDNFEKVLSDPNYLNSVKVTLIFSVSTAFVAMALALLLAVMADRVIRAKGFYRTLLIWPYAVAPAIAIANAVNARNRIRSGSTPQNSAEPGARG